MRGPTAAAAHPPLSLRQRGQMAAITAAAVLGWVGLHLLGGPAPLSPMDFVVGGADALQFCDPNNPRFLPVVTRSLPVTLAVSGPGRRFTLTTVTGKPVRLRDLSPTDGAPLRLFVVNRALTRFYALRPRPGLQPGEWVVPTADWPADSYRAFADFTPSAISREVYASADLPAPPPGTVPAAAPLAPAYHFALASIPARISALQPITLTLTAERADHGPVVFSSLGGVRAHLVAFDQACSGMVHLRANETGPSEPGQPRAQASFQVTFPDSGEYVLWAEVTVNGRTVSPRFACEVSP